MEDLFLNLLNPLYNYVKKDLKKGSECSVQGNKYENAIYNIVKHTKINGKNFNTQKKEELGCSSARNDIECNYVYKCDIGIEIKKANTPDWMQCVLKYDAILNKWKTSEKSKIPEDSRHIFDKLIKNVNLYNKPPPFLEKDITHKEWLQIKQEDSTWNDKYISIPDNTIRQLYYKKHCQYIQISDGYGLYRLNDDVCEFKVPLFTVKQRLRIRIKVHTKKNNLGYCKLSVTMSCQPINIKQLKISDFSLDNKEKLPQNLIYEFNEK